MSHTESTDYTEARIVNSRVPPDAYTRQADSEGVATRHLLFPTASDLKVRGFCDFRVRHKYSAI